jgi:hypothetical protein
MDTSMSSPESLSPHLSSIESLKASLPEKYRYLFDSLLQDIKDYCKANNLPFHLLSSSEAFTKAVGPIHPSLLEPLKLRMERLAHLIKHKEPMPEKSENLEYADTHYRLTEQYTSQVSLLEQVGILKDGHIEGIDGERYPVPTLEQIAERIFERREELSPKHDQGFTKLLLVPFGMSLDTLMDTFKHFLLSYKQQHPDFELNTDEPLWAWDDYKKADTATSPDGSPFLVYHPTSFDPDNHQGKSKAQILEEQFQNPSSFPGWTIHLFQPSNPKDPNSPGIALIPREGKGTSYGQDPSFPLDLSTPSRPDLEAGQSPEEYLSVLQSSHNNPDSSYHLETGLTPEDWIIAFITHLQETGKHLDNFELGTQSSCFLIGVLFPSCIISIVPSAYWIHIHLKAIFGRLDPDSQHLDIGSRFSVMI